MSSVYEFVVYVQFQADGEDEASQQLVDFLSDPTLDCYAIGVRSGRPPRVVAEDDH